MGFWGSWHRISKLTAFWLAILIKWVILALCLAGEHHRVKKQMQWGEEWPGNCVFTHRFLYTVSFRKRMGQSPFSRAQVNQIAWQQRLGCSWKALTFLWCQWNPWTQFYFYRNKYTVAILRPLYDDIFKKNQNLIQGQGIGGRKSINVTEQTVRTMSR